MESGREMNPDLMSQVPKEFYYLVGLLVVGNISTIISYFKNQTDRAVVIAVMKKEIETINILINKHDSDIRAAHDKIREIEIG
jgi:hypothetical protein